MEEPSVKLNNNNHYRVIDEPLRWNAAEYNHMNKGFWWYLVFSFITVLLVMFDIFFLKTPLWTFSILVLVMAVALIIYAKRPPKELPYTLSSEQGLYIADRLYQFSEFKSFGIVHEENKMHIGLIPIKRFAPMVSVYFPEELGESLVEILGSKLPMQEIKIDIIDGLVRRLRL